MRRICLLLIFTSVTLALKFLALEFNGNIWSLDADAQTQTLLRTTTYSFQQIAGPDCFGRFAAIAYTAKVLLQIKETGEVTTLANFSASRPDFTGLTFGYNNELWAILQDLPNDTLYKIQYENGTSKSFLIIKEMQAYFSMFPQTTTYFKL